jgi:hypothetical protein
VREASLSKQPTIQSGGVHISGRVGTIGGDVIGGNKITTTATEGSTINIQHSELRPVADIVEHAAARVKGDAQKKLAALDEEVGKGKNAQDSVVAGLLQDLVGLVPKAATAVVSAFASPILAALAGPATKYVIDRLRGS